MAIRYAYHGAWAGYDHAIVIASVSEDEAEQKGFDIAREGWMGGGLSFSAEKIETTVEKTALYKQRLKSSARDELLLAGDISNI